MTIWVSSIDGLRPMNTISEAREFVTASPTAHFVCDTEEDQFLSDPIARILISQAFKEDDTAQAAEDTPEVVPDPSTTSRCRKLPENRQSSAQSRSFEKDPKNRIERLSKDGLLQEERQHLPILNTEIAELFADLDGKFRLWQHLWKNHCATSVEPLTFEDTKRQLELDRSYEDLFIQHQQLRLIKTKIAELEAEIDELTQPATATTHCPETQEDRQSRCQSLESELDQEEVDRVIKALRDGDEDLRVESGNVQAAVRDQAEHLVRVCRELDEKRRLEGGHCAAKHRPSEDEGRWRELERAQDYLQHHRRQQQDREARLAELDAQVEICALPPTSTDPAFHLPGHQSDDWCSLFTSTELAAFKRLATFAKEHAIQWCSELVETRRAVKQGRQDNINPTTSITPPIPARSHRRPGPKPKNLRFHKPSSYENIKPPFTRKNRSRSEETAQQQNRSGETGQQENTEKGTEVSKLRLELERSNQALDAYEQVFESFKSILFPAPEEATSFPDLGDVNTVKKTRTTTKRRESPCNDAATVRSADDSDRSTKRDKGDAPTKVVCLRYGGLA
ncbi:hypothetical protein H2200_006597 [Cladophialophora chaetospira]|uniref:Uncharacterized protein n=1 Tax=Cladophialophora chaetospira TaxID=386627 RepID=A0AA38X8H8_9EURO|nr:hypothetical protein H2200_006597 [Cladophialophora chaetospira]